MDQCVIHPQIRGVALPLEPFCQKGKVGKCAGQQTPESKHYREPDLAISQPQEPPFF